MSQQEFDQADQQVIGIVESHAHPDAKKAAAKICKGERQEGAGPREIATSPVAPRNDSMECNGASGDARAAELRRRILLTAIQVLGCVLVAALFVAALIDPSIVVFLANVGVLVCGMVAAILVDRSIRIRRKG